MRFIKINIIILIILSNFLYAEDVQLGKVLRTKNKFYICDTQNKTVTIATLSRTGEYLSQRLLSKRKTNKQIKSFTLRIKNLAQQISQESNKKRKAKLKSTRQNIIKINKNLKKCLSNKVYELAEKKDFIPESIPISYTAPPVFNATATAIGKYKANCTLEGKNIPAYQDNPDFKLQAPESASLKCTLTSAENISDSILLKITEKNNPKKIIFSSRVKKEQVKNNSFKVTLCSEFPGCYYANIVAKTIGEKGIDVVIEDSI